MTPQRYKFDYSFISNLQNPKKVLFKAEIGWRKESKHFSIEVTPKGYLVNKSQPRNTRSKINALSFFSGAGGLDIGAQLAGVKVLAGHDFDRDCIATLKSNKCFDTAEHDCSDIQSKKGKDFSELLRRTNPDKLIFIGGPPCQPFSKAGYWVTHERRLYADDPRNMIGQYFRLIKEIKPDGFLLENVESLLHPKNKNQVEEILETIERLGYKSIVYRADALDFGVPQKRKRVFFIAARKPIEGLPQITHGEESDDRVRTGEILPYERVIDWISKYDDPQYFEPQEVVIGKTYGDEIAEIPPGENYFALTERENYPNPKFEANKRFWSFLLKLHPLKPSWTIAAQPGPWVGPFHWANRRLRAPEIASIQTFPEDYHFIGSRRSIQKQIGNAVPPLLAKAMTQFLVKQL